MTRNRQHDRIARGRREFIAASLGLGGVMASLGAPLPAAASHLLANVARAGNTTRLVVVFAQGGWDTTYVFDPKPGSKIVSQAPGDIAQVQGIRYWSHDSRANVDAFFQARASQCVVVNGISVRSFGHLECTRRLLAGDLSQERSDVAAAFGHAQPSASSAAVPYLVLGDAAITGPFAADAVRIGAINQLSALLRESVNQGADATALYGDPGVRLEGDLSELISAHLARRADQVALPPEYRQSVARYDALKRFAGESGGLGALGFAQPLAAQREIAVAALASGFSHSVFLQTGSWDTHVNNSSQSALFDELFGELTTLAQQLESAGIWNETVVLVLSEMARTPALNSTQGKDHWPFSSALLFGGPLIGGRVLGATDDGQRALSLDLRSGLPMSDGQWLQHDVFYNGLLDLLGLPSELAIVGAGAFEALRGR